MHELEKHIQSHILEYLKLRRILCWKNSTSGIYVRSRDTYIPSHAVGVSDILGVLPGGRILCIEVKSESGRLSDAQKAFLENVTARGGVAFVAQSLEDVEAKLFPKKSVKMQPGKKYRPHAA